MRTIYRITGQRHKGQQAVAAIAAAKVGDAVTLEREPGNQYDAFAVKVVIGGVHVGYIPAAMTRKGLAKYVDENGAPPLEGESGPTLTGTFAIEDRQPAVQIDELTEERES